MTTSPKTAVESAVESREPIPAGVMAYLSARARGHWFDYVHAKLREAEAGGLTRKALASRIGKSPTRLSHILSNPGNWTIDTVSELLIGIAREEVIPKSEPLLGKPPRNRRQEDAFGDVGLSPRAEFEWESTNPLSQMTINRAPAWTFQRSDRLDA